MIQVYRIRYFLLRYKEQLATKVLTITCNQNYRFMESHQSVCLFHYEVKHIHMYTHTYGLLI
jgi:hypothetical protein